ncbi:helix-turn-helix domain-containing protein [Clostridium prolinivorans]|uniref:helix-turn-helix domain-containing protein n=1 Tax=Clostridium prolinivorans TaxID=2769420 RepID=UPI000FDA97E4|nr:helix-turn-helix transcriptional regulator [Clostridium prolinivorans]
MGFSYNKLWKILIDRGMNKTALRDGVGFTPTTLSRLSKNETVSMNMLARICEYLNCDIGDIVEYKCEGKVGKGHDKVSNGI